MVFLLATLYFIYVQIVGLSYNHILKHILLVNVEMSLWM